MKRTVLALSLLAVSACGRTETPSMPAAPKPPATAQTTVTSGLENGKLLMQQYGCLTCHIVPGIDGPRGMVGPSLEAFASRPKILDKIPNTDENLVSYLQNPSAIDPQTSMPNLGISAEEAKDIAAYLATLK